MALKCRGPGSPLNFGLEEYEELLPMLPNLSKVWSMWVYHILPAAPCGSLALIHLMPWFPNLACCKAVSYSIPAAG